MAKIPDFTALGPAPTPEPARSMFPIRDDSGAMIAEAGGELGRGLQQFGDDQYQHNQQLLSAKGENAVLDHHIAVASAGANLRQQVLSGQVPYQQAQQNFQEQVQKIPTPALAGLDPTLAASLQRTMKANVAQEQLALQGTVEQAQRDDFKGQFATGLDKLSRLAGMPGANIDAINSRADTFAPLARSAGLPQAYVDETLQNFKEGNWQNDATQRAMLAKGNGADLKQLQFDLTDPKGYYAGKLDTNRRNTILHQVVDDQLILQNQQEHLQDKRDAAGQRAMYQLDEQTDTGVPASPAQLDQWQQATRGTSSEKDFDGALQDEQQVQQLLRKPIEQQLAYVQQREQTLDQQGGTLRDVQNLRRLQGAVTQNVNLMQHDPLLFNANRNGTQVEPLNLQQLGTPQGAQAVGAQLSDRMTTLTAMRKQYGSAVPLQPLLPQEAADLSAQLTNATPQDRTQLLVSLHGAFGDDAGYQAAMRQIAPHSPVTAIAGQMLGSTAPAQTPVWYHQNFAASTQDVQTILQGESLLNPVAAGKGAAQGEEAGKGVMKGGMPMPPDVGQGGLRATFGRAAGDMFRNRPQLADAYYSVFKDAYAGLLAQNGNMKGLGDPGLERQALQMALGHTVDFNGHTIAVPRGMDPGDFEGYVKTAVGQAMTEAKAPADWADRIRGYGLQEVGGVGSGRYELVNGNSPLVSPDGKGPLVLDMRNAFLPGSAGAQAYATANAPAPEPNWLLRAK